MNYKNLEEGKFINRENRFIALVEIGGQVERVHVPNTGRCRELFIPRTRVLLQKAGPGSERKTAYSLIHVEKEGRWINIDSQSPNKLVEDFLRKKPELPGFGPVLSYKREVVQGKSRLDFQIFSKEKEGFIEVKGVTLEKWGHSFFPDAPTLRGKKHIDELCQLVKEGKPSFVFFVIQMKGVHTFSPNWEMDPLFSKTLLEAKEKGVGVLAMDTLIEEGNLTLDKEVFVHWLAHIEIERGKRENIPQMLEIYEEAVDALKEDGVDQWQNSWPIGDLLKKDIEENWSYIYKDQGRVLAAAALIGGEEETYKNISGGTWPNDKPYTTIHRFAVGQINKNKGLGKKFIQGLIDKSFEMGYKNVRIDTHKDNSKMLKLIRSMDFEYCGLIQLKDGSKRLAFSKELE